MSLSQSFWNLPGNSVIICTASIPLHGNVTEEVDLFIATAQFFPGFDQWAIGHSLLTEILFLMDLGLKNLAGPLGHVFLHPFIRGNFSSILLSLQRAKLIDGLPGEPFHFLRRENLGEPFVHKNKPSGTILDGLPYLFYGFFCLDHKSSCHLRYDFHRFDSKVPR